MKSQNGITLSSLAIYLVLIFITLAILATVTANYRNSLKDNSQKGTEIAQINNFNMFFLQEVKKQGNEIRSISSSQVEFTTGKVYRYDSQNKTIYLQNPGNEGTTIAIAENIDRCEFSTSLENGKKIIQVIIKAQNVDIKTYTYVLNNEEIENNYEDEQTYIVNQVNN